MKWYWAILIQLVAIALGITLLFVMNKLLKNEDMKKHLDESTKHINDIEKWKYK